MHPRLGFPGSRTANFVWAPLALAPFLLACAIGCSASSTAESGSSGPRGSTSPTSPTGSAAPGQGGGAGIQAGTLTSGAWDDNLNFDFYLGYVDAVTALEQQDPAWPLLSRADRLEILVTNDQGSPLSDAAVTISGPTGELARSATRSDGRLYAVPSWFGAPAGTPLLIAATRDGLAGSTLAIAGDAQASVAIAGAVATLPQTLDVALVIDTTGSMGDEISYLKVELDSIVTEVRAAYPGVAQRFALVVYRDEGDSYVVRSTDFTTNLSDFTSVLRQQTASGGGDYPEAPDQALAALGQLRWSATGAARMVFWVADAPHHAQRTQAMLNDFKQSFSGGVHIYPVASSGVDELTEFTMRTAAQLTGGRYLFLTDDSGIGDAHKEPTLPCYVVTTLQKAMLRMVFMELSGTHVEAAPVDVLRSAGAPVAGTCAQAGGRQLRSL